jgi:hypothetical protein
MYKVVRVEAAASVANGEVTCLSCGGLLRAQDGAFSLKYFLVDRPSRQQQRSG